MDDLTRLALAAQRGDREALTAFVRRAQPDVWRLCAHLSGPGQADDVTQEALIRALGALPAFRAESSARTWVLAITRRTCIDHVRGLVRRRRLLDRLTRAELVVDEGACSELDALLVQLDPDRRAAFVLTQVIGLSYAETAEVCGCAVGTIRSRVSRARADLVRWLNDADRATG